MPVPNQFANVTTSIPLSQLDANFNTPITLGNTAIQLGNTVTTLNNMTLANVTISSGNVTITNVSVTTANVTTANIGTQIVTTSQTLNYGTPNGVVYLNGSKVSTTGTALTFDGTNFGIGTASPSFRLDVQGTDGIGGITSTTGTNTVNWRLINSGGTLFTGIDSSTGGNFTGTAYAGVLWHSGNYPLVFATNNTVRMRINAGAPVLCLAGGNTSATGTGIAFPATQSASSDANTLDDYEEGTWTPQLQFNNANVGMTGSFSGRYVKVGNQVTIFAYVVVTNKGSSTGAATLINLPFNPITAGQAFAAASLYVGATSITVGAGQMAQANINGTVSRIDLNGLIIASGSDFNLTQANFNAAGSFWISATYITS